MGIASIWVSDDGSDSGLSAVEAAQKHCCSGDWTVALGKLSRRGLRRRFSWALYLVSWSRSSQIL